MRWLTRAPGLRTALIVGALLVIARSLVFALYEHVLFDSDQAILGLMAKHLSEGRAFPLFIYGQPYLLGVESWLAVPFFWVAGPTVAALRASLIAWNIAVVTLIIVGLHRYCGLRPALALVVSLFVAFPPPDTVADLVDAGGGNIEPFLVVLVLWFVRARPFWFGSVLAAGFLNREFVIYAVPVLVAGQWWSGTLFRMSTVRAWLFSLVAFLAVWQGVQGLVPYSDAMGPGTDGTLPTATRGQLENLSQRAQFEVRGLPERAMTVLTAGVGGLLGGRQTASEPQGRNWVGIVLGLALVAGVVRLGVIWRRGLTAPATSFAWYLLGIGVVAAAAYAVARPGEDPVRRYMLLSLFIPIGLTALWLIVEPVLRVRQAIVAFVVAWAIVAGVDNWSLFHRYRTGAVPDPMGEIVSALEARGVSVAEAPYWRAYKLTFLTGERIKVASTDVVRITEYQTLAREAAPVVRLQDSPCAGGQRVAGMYLCEPAQNNVARPGSQGRVWRP
jgi:hypothetical protein